LKNLCTVWNNNVRNIGGTKDEEIFPIALGQIFFS